MATYTQDKLYDLWFDNKITERDLDLKLVQLHIEETSTAERKAEITKAFQQSEGDTGSVQVQVAILTERIKNLTAHLKEHKHDYSTRRGLLGQVSKRSRLLRYLERTDRQAYLDLIGKLGLRK